MTYGVIPDSETFWARTRSPVLMSPIWSAEPCCMLSDSTTYTGGQFCVYAKSETRSTTMIASATRGSKKRESRARQ